MHAEETTKKHTQHNENTFTDDPPLCTSWNLLPQLVNAYADGLHVND